MSRFRIYDVLVEVTFPVDKKEKLEKEIISTLDGLFDDEDNDNDIIAVLENKLELQGTWWLSDEQSTEEAHKIIKDEFKKLEQDIQIVTKWHLSEWDWEDIFRD